MKLLLLLALLLSTNPLTCQILQVKLLFSGCQDTVVQQSIIEKLKGYPGAKSSQHVMDLADFQVIVNWDKPAQMHSKSLFQTFSQEFPLTEIELIVEGKLEQGGANVYLRSFPENTLFFIRDNDAAQLKKETKNFRARKIRVQARIGKANLNNQIDILNYQIL
ncbi:MAG TPA: hypothetical protein VN457_00375 [Chlamydiales bacterium]|nr:hypothetical protein [Chlamydiales bacterium]